MCVCLGGGGQRDMSGTLKEKEIESGDKGVKKSQRRYDSSKRD